MKRTWLVISTVLLFFLSCTDWNQIQYDLNNPEDFHELAISSDFDWRTSLNVAFYITPVENGIIKITSVDGEIVFHKGYYNGSALTYNAIVNLPLYLDSVKINQDIIVIDDNIIQYNLGGLKSGSNFKDINADYSLSFDGQNDYVEISKDDLIISKR